MTKNDILAEHRKGRRRWLGWLYAAESDSLPGILKIGHTNLSKPIVRGYALSSAVVPKLGLERPFKIVWCHRMSEAAAAERALHHNLDPYRVTFKQAGYREFYRLSLEQFWELADIVLGRKVNRTSWLPYNFTRKQGRELQIVKHYRNPLVREWMGRNIHVLEGISYDDMSSLCNKEFGKNVATRWLMKAEWNVMGMEPWD